MATAWRGMQMRGTAGLIWVSIVLLVGVATAAPAATAGWPGLSYADRQHGWYVDSHGSALVALERTKNGGKTFDVLKTSFTYAAGGGAGVLFPSARLGFLWGFIATPYGTLVRTTDGGATWRGVSWSELAFADDVVFSDADHGWAASHDDPYTPEGGVIAKSDDGGASWKSVHRVAGDGEPTELAAPTASHCYVLQRHRSRPTLRLFATSDGGRTWSRRSLPSAISRAGWDGHPQPSMAFPRPQTGWLAGEAGQVFKTRDGGKTWRRQRSRTTRSLTDVCFVDVRFGWISGERGVLLTTRDGGAHWRRQASGTSARLHTVHFVDRRHGWAAPWYGGPRLRTVDGGRTWRRL
jgi:photosystem II stability/assembly factor-like uncharacterized protein